MTSRPVHNKGVKTYIAACSLSTALLFPALSGAETVSTAEWNISADKITRYENPESVVAEGNIILEKRVTVPPKQDDGKVDVSSWSELLGEAEKKVEANAAEVLEQIEAEPVKKTTFRIEADWIAYDVEKEEIKARGNVRVAKEDDTLLAESGQVDLNTETGTFNNAVIIRKEDDLHLEGEVVEKTGYNTYHIEKGWVITCKVEPGETPPWSFGSSDTVIKEGGYAFMKNATFNIKGVPVFYTPYMVVPVKNTRQTGFLLPELSFSDNNGFGMNLPFFLNINDSVDMTFFPEFYTDRGVMPGVEFRYVRDEYTKGSFAASYLDDALSDPSETQYYADTGYTHTNSDRYWLRGKADQTFGDDWNVRLDLDIVSDRDYLKEFDDGYTGFDDTEGRFLEVFGRGLDNNTATARDNSLNILKSWSGQSLEVNLLAVNDVAEEDVDSTELWRLPEVEYDGLIPLWETGISLEWDSQYVNFWREEGTGGSRVDIRPAISGSIPLSAYLESRAELGVRETYYMVETFGESEWTEDDTQDRLTADFEFEVATTLMRSFDTDNDAVGDLDHQLRPFVKYDYIPDVDQDELPYFDSIDRIGEQNEITYGVDNYFTTYSGDSDRDIGFVKLYQYYDLRSSESDEPFGEITLELGYLPTRLITLKYDTDFDPYGDGFVKHRVEGEYMNSRGDIFSLDYSFKDYSNIEQINAYVKTRLIDNWSTEISVEHSIAEDETNEANAALIYEALCWSVEFQTRYSPEDMKYILVFNLANIGTPLGIRY